MGQLTLTLLTTEVQDYIPDKPMAAIGRAANNIIKRIYRHIAPTQRYTFTTVAPYSTGTVAVITGDVSVNLTGGSWAATDVGALIKIQGSDIWYTIATVAPTLALTLSSKWEGETGTGLTYEIVYPFVTLPSTVLSPIDIWRPGEAKLRFAANERVGEIVSSPTTDRPVFWSPVEMDTGATPDDSYKIQLTPAPDSKYTYQYHYMKRPGLFTTSDGATKSNLPAIFDDAILAGTLMLCWDQEDKQDRSLYWKGVFLEALREALAETGSVFSPELEDADEFYGPLENRPIG